MTKDMKMKKPAAKKGTLGRVIKSLFKFYPVLVPIAMVCVLFTAIVAVMPALYIQKITELIGVWQPTGDWAAASREIIPEVITLICFYVVSVITNTLYNQLMAYITQGYLCKMRRAMFDGMQNLPIKPATQKKSV